MILRRLSKHLKDQNWLAVALDFVIVVAGVYLGVLLGNWNADSAAERSERAVLLQLHDELLEAKAEVGPGSYNYIDDYPTAIQAVLGDFFDGEDNLPREALCTSVTTSHTLLNSVGELSAVSELISTGRLSRINDPDLRSAIASFHELSTRKRIAFRS